MSRSGLKKHLPRIVKAEGTWIAANAADEAEKGGKKRITPYWRTLKTGGILNEKYPGGLENLKKRLEAEGHTVIPKGRSKHFMVQGFEKLLIDVDKIKL